MTRINRRKNVYDPLVQQRYQEQTQQGNYNSEYQEQPSQEQMSQEQMLQEQHRQEQQRLQQQRIEQENTSDFGDSRNPVNIARSVERKPTPPGICEMMIGGRPIDLHAFEDYLVWKVSPYQLRTLLRYHNARTIEEIKNYSLRPTLKMKSGTLVLLVLAVLMLVGGLAIFMFMPELTAMFKGFSP